MTSPVKETARSTPRRASLIFTLYGDYVHGGGREALAIGSLVRLMAEFGLSEAAVRQAVSRMARQGWLRPRKIGGRAHYELTQRGAGRVESIAPRIYEPAHEWDGRWRVLMYSIGEAQRDVRDRLRKDLTLLGMAPLAAATWISPREIAGSMRELTESLGENVHFFSAEYLGPLGDRELLERCWDIDAIATAYRDFLERYTPRLKAERTTHALSDEEAFVERLWLVQDFRRFVYLDPGLPSALLPAHWPGTLASTLFREYYALIATKALAFFKAA